tara:strand:+ start:156 stop:662 length:507 start_codon:yes stop_codon:yes gene_type:complete
MGLPAVAAGAAAGASLLSARATMQAGKAQANAAAFNAQVNERNAQKAQLDKESAKLGSELAIQRFSREFGRIQAETGQAVRKNGFVATRGTPALIALQNAREADLEIAARRFNASVESRAFDELSVEQELQASLSRMEGAAASRAARTRAASTLLGGASSTITTYRST